MLPSHSFIIGLFLAIPSFTAAQTWTNCNPLNGTCPSDLALGLNNYTADFTQGLDNKIWNVTAGTITTGSNGAEYTINKRFDSPTMQSEFYFMFGVVEVHLKAASGQGVISSIVLESDDLDEVDWEWMGGNKTHVETNYFGKGNTTAFDRAFYYPVDGPMDGYHNYTLLWTSEKIEWYVDSVVVRTLAYADANDGNNYPQTPMTLRLGIWAGGDEANSPGTIEWAGGKTDYTKGPYTMYVQSARVSDFGTGKDYTYSDTSGSWQSIKSTSGTSTVAEEIQNPSSSSTSTSSSSSSSSSSSPASSSSPSSSSASASPTASATSQSIADGWNKMSNSAHVAIYASGSAAAAALAGLITLCCIKQRRRGIKDREAEAQRLDAQRKEDEAYAGMELKEQDSLPLTTPTPAQFASRDNSIKNESYLSSREVAATPPPVYQNQTYGNTGRVERTAGTPAFNGNGFDFSSDANSRGAPSPVSPASLNSMNRGYGNASFASNGYASNGYPSNGYPNNGYPNNGYSNNGYSNNGFHNPGPMTGGYSNGGGYHGSNRF
ncbi:MAG: hypothetical protein M1818_003836 [Claussenomyces sp. TS43310]|nr:MAG: hypothetical protein M1818_003836 [Claussenomyces sp. TS43310]